MNSYLENEPNVYSYIQTQSFSVNLVSILIYTVAFASLIVNDSTLDTKMPGCDLQSKCLMILEKYNCYVLSLKKKFFFSCFMYQAKAYLQRPDCKPKIVCESKMFAIEAKLRQLYFPSNMSPACMDIFTSKKIYVKSMQPFVFDICANSPKTYRFPTVANYESKFNVKVSISITSKYCQALVQTY